MLCAACGTVDVHSNSDGEYDRVPVQMLVHVGQATGPALYMWVRMWVVAVHVVLQEDGNYRVAHDKLFATVRQLETLRHRVPLDLLRALMLLHSYTLVKSLIAINDHTSAARMLVRVARWVGRGNRGHDKLGRIHSHSGSPNTAQGQKPLVAEAPDVQGRLIPLLTSTGWSCAHSGLLATYCM